MREYALLVALVLLYALGCTPKTTEQAKASDIPQEPVEEEKNPCATFDDVDESVLDAHVIYRDYKRVKNIEQAFPFWQQAFAAAPAADGKRQTHYEDGIDFYEYFIEQSESNDQKRAYIDTIFGLYDQMAECYHAGDVGYIAGRKAFDLYYKYRDLVTNEEILDLYRLALDTDGLETQAFVINPFTALLVEMFQYDQIDQDEAVKYAKQILAICDEHEDDPEEGWPIVVGYAPVRLEAFETVKGFYDCDYFLEKYYEPIDLDSTDCEELFIIATRLRYGGCEVESEALQKLSEAYSSRCRVGPDPLLAEARTALEESRYRDAIESYLKYLEELEDPERLAQFNLRISKIYYAHVRDFPQARKYAREALKYRPDWGEPYIVIGKLYASSGPLCGPGRGWDSQIVTWPAIDKFRRAKQLDPSVASEANRLIASYQKYMPSVEDIFQRQLNAGDSFRVGCWIQENTTIRPAKK